MSLNFLNKTINYTINGNELEFAKINLGMIAKFEQALKKKELNKIQPILETMKTAEKIQFIKEFSKPIDMETLMDEMQTMTGLIEIVYLSLSKVNPEVTEEQVGELISFGNFNELTELLNLLLDVPEQPKN